MGKLYHTPSSQDSGMLAKEKEDFNHPEVVDGYQETVLSRHSRAVDYMNPEQL